MDEWSGVSGIRFIYLGNSTHRTADDLDDGTALVHWVSPAAAGWTARASPTMNVQVDRSLGYRPIVGGYIELNSNDAALTNAEDSQTIREESFVSAMTHEIGHLIGFGHSDDPTSIMYANPYNDFIHLADDDVRAAQALYGMPASYRGPVRLADPALSTNAHFRDSAVENDAKQLLARVTDSSAGRVMASVTLAGAYSGFIGFTLVDSDGLVLEHQQIAEKCDPEYTCTLRTRIATAADLKRLPGNKTLFLDFDGNYVAANSLRVDTSFQINRMPAAKFSVSESHVKISDPVKIRLEVGPDPEGDEITATWHIPGVGEQSFLVDSKGGIYQSVVSFDEPGDYRIFVSLNDDVERYGTPDSGTEAGEGFRLALQQVVSVR
jgi:hypothetical protein